MRSSMALDFRRDYLVQLPLPLAQLYSRAYNAKDARGRHDNTFYLFEAVVKVLSSGTLPDGQLYYAMEYVPGCDLELVWRELSGSDVKGDISSLGSSTWAKAVLSA